MYKGKDGARHSPLPAPRRPPLHLTCPPPPSPAHPPGLRGLLHSYPGLLLRAPGRDEAHTVAHHEVVLFLSPE